ncbi:hypothetical protein PRZ48_005351 [Zasmidium cellare]|uniref:Polyketide synthase n=1 Tax=Zasmidium cellare TaxID=395010 RepID=A0ABR0ETJ3_ZASCE|nr:hypothetical protein PRZ48_005351 [Zasmidium cellare]
MMASTPPSTVYFFGNEFPHDDLRDLFRSLVRHAKDRRFSLVAAFVRESTRVLRAEIDKLPKAVRDEVPYFESILHLPDHGMFRESSLGAAMESAFLVALQVGMFIGHHESHGLDLGDTQGTSIASGLSIGLFSGAAVATARTLGDLVKTGVESLRVAFRLGVFVQDFSQKLESPHHEGTQQSWAHVVTGLSKDTIEGELAPYNDKPGVSPLSKVFISAADKASVGVTGPPSHLRAAFLQSQPLRHSRSLALPVYDGVCHAQHIYSHSDIEAVLGTPVDPSFERRKVCIPLISSQHGTPFDAATGNQLLQSICTELLTGTIYMDNISNGIVQLLEGAEGSSSPLFCTFRTSIATKSIVESINSHLAKDGLSLSMNDLVSWTFADQGPRQPASHADAKLAIVGVACRMPGGANDPEQFWSSLEKGYNACVRVPEDRFDLETHFDPTGETENASQTEFGNFIDRPGKFFRDMKKIPITN